MVVGVLRLALVLHAPQNLKEKRGVVRRVLDRCRQRFPVSAAEVGQQDLWQRCDLGFSLVSTDVALIERTFSKIEEEISALGVADVTARDSELLHY